MPHLEGGGSADSEQFAISDFMAMATFLSEWGSGNQEIYTTDWDIH